MLRQMIVLLIAAIVLTVFSSCLEAYLTSETLPFFDQTGLWVLLGITAGLFLGWCGGHLVRYCWAKVDPNLASNTPFVSGYALSGGAVFTILSIVFLYLPGGETASGMPLLLQVTCVFVFWASVCTIVAQCMLPRRCRGCTCQF